MTLYVSRDLRSIHLPITQLIVCVRWAADATATADNGGGMAVPAYKLTPLLHAALELQLDQLDDAYTAGRLSAERARTAVDRISMVWNASNAELDPEQVRKARRVLAGRLDALAWVVGQYIERMGGREAVAELERGARREIRWDMDVDGAVDDGGMRIGAHVGVDVGGDRDGSETGIEMGIEDETA